MATVPAESRLLDLAHARDWEGAVHRARLNPSELSAVDGSGYTALHHAAMGGASARQVKSLLATRTGRRATLIRCREGGWTPMHLCCRSIASDDIILSIALSHPDSMAVQDEEGDTGLHSALRYGASEFVLQALIHLASNRVGTAIIQTADFADGDLPLHSAIRHEAPTTIIELLLDACPHSVAAKNLEWKSPLHLACELGRHDVIAVLIDRIKDFMGTEGLMQHICLEDWHRCTPIGALWNKYLESVKGCVDHITYDQLIFIESAEQIEIWESIVLLVTSAYFRGKVDFDPGCRSRSQAHLLIQAVIGLGCACPPPLLRFLVKRYPLVLSTPNANGRLPIHEAILAPSSHDKPKEKTDGNASISEHDNNVCHEEQDANASLDCNLIGGLKEQGEMFKEEDCLSDIASSLDSAKSELSSSALHVLIDAYPQGAFAQDEEGRLPLHLAALSCLSWKDGTESIFQAAPEALRVQDKKTGLFPFMLAATAKKEDDLSAVDKVYRMLRSGPELVAPSHVKQISSEEKKNPRNKKRKGMPSQLQKKRKDATSTR